jgi:hypothetical protein
VTCESAENPSLFFIAPVPVLGVDVDQRRIDDRVEQATGVAEKGDIDVRVQHLRLEATKLDGNDGGSPSRWRLFVAGPFASVARRLR